MNPGKMIQIRINALFILHLNFLVCEYYGARLVGDDYRESVVHEFPSSHLLCFTRVEVGHAVYSIRFECMQLELCRDVRTIGRRNA